MITSQRCVVDTPLTPLRFLRRAADVYPEKTAIVDGSRRLSYTEAAESAAAVARAIAASGVGAGDSIAYLAGNSAELVIAHFGVPLAGAALVAINTRLSSDEIAYILDHCSAGLVFADGSLADHHGAVLASAAAELVVLPEQDGTGGTYESFLARGCAAAEPEWAVADETATIAINYTSGTTGRPRGVTYTHRGAYLNALGQVIHQGFDFTTNYLWTLPLFHCNGWCGAWAVTAVAGTHVCLRAVRGPDIWRLLAEENIDHMSGAPAVLSIMAEAAEAHPLERPLSIATGGAPPSPAATKQLEELGARVFHLYGLTETYGPYAMCEYQPTWAGLDPEALSVKLARQGVGMITADELRVVQTDPDTLELEDVPCDGVAVGEIVMRGNTVMKGYYRDEAATATAFAGGWFHSGDLGVRHPDGYVQLVDRAKDVVISGGENISSVELEQALLSHPAVAEVAVIGVPDERWGERPKAYVVLRAEKVATEEELIAHVKVKIAGYKAPKMVAFVDALPRSATGKVLKQQLRDLEWAGRATRIHG